MNINVQSIDEVAIASRELEQSLDRVAEALAPEIFTLVLCDIRVERVGFTKRGNTPYLIYKSDILPAPDGLPSRLGLPKIAPESLLLRGGSQAAFLHSQLVRLFDGCKTYEFYDLCRSHISVCCVSTFITLMHSLTEFLLASMRLTQGTSLTRQARIYLGKVDSSFLANPAKDLQESAPSSIKAMFCQHTSAACFQV